MALNLSLRTKLAVTIVTIGVIVSGVNLYQTVEVERASEATRKLVNEDMERLDRLQQARVENARLLPVLNIDTSASEALINPTIQTELNNYARNLQRETASYIAQSKEDPDHTFDEKLFVDLTTTVEGVVTATAALSTNTASAFNELNDKTAQVDAIIGTLEKGEREGVADRKAAIESATGQVKLMFIFMTLGVTGASVLIGIILMTSISRSLAKIKAGATRIANGDFSAPLVIESNDELGQLGKSFNSMSERLKDSYRRLAVEQQRDEAILQGMGEGLIATDEKGRVLVINHIGAEYLLVNNIKAAMGRPVEELYQLYPADAKDDTQPLSAEKRPVYMAIAQGEPIKDVFAFYKSDGKKALLDIMATPIKLDNKVVGAISIMRDVTKEREIDRMKTEFISLASHQLRTPLSAIKWYTEMLIAGDAGQLTPDQLEFATNVDDSTTRMIALVNALLNISRIESGRIMIDPKPTDLRELVTGIVNDLKAKTEEKQQTLIISVHDDLPKIDLDPRLISQVYLNLLTNAIKYTPKGGEVSVFISRKDDQVISQVTDNGYGIPKDQQGKIFQKFFRAANAVKVETDGTGLGLYLIKAVVESSGGKIWFDSEEGKGTTFWFSIPLSGMKAKEGEVTLDG